MGCAQSGPVGPPLPPNNNNSSSSSTAIVLPSIHNRLPESASGWEQWSIDDIIYWSRMFIRSHSQQSAVAIMVVHETNGSILHLIHETAGNNGNIADSAELRLINGTPRFGPILDALRSVRRRRRGDGPDNSIYSDLLLGNEEEEEEPTPAPVPAPAPPPVPVPAPPPAPPVVPSTVTTTTETESLDNLDLGPLGVAMASMKRALASAAEAQAKEARERKREAEEWETKRLELEAAKRTAEAKSDEEHAHYEALLRQLDTMREAVRRADAERDKERERAIAAEVNAKEVVSRVQVDLEEARAHTAVAVAEARSIAETLLREREASWARDRETLLKEMSDMRDLLVRTRTAHAEKEAQTEEHIAKLEAQAASILESGRRLEIELRDCKQKLSVTEEEHNRALEELRSKMGADAAAAATALEQSKTAAIVAETAAKEAGERRITALQHDLENKDKLLNDTRARIAALEAALTEARAHTEKIITESDEHIALIRADCEAKVAVVRDESAKEVEAAHHAVESTTLNAAKSVAEAQHELQEVRERYELEIERIKRLNETERIAALNKAEADKEAAIAAIRDTAEAHALEVETDWEKRFSMKDEELARVRENLESVSTAFRSECAKVTALDAEIRTLKAEITSTKRKNLFASAAKAAVSSAALSGTTNTDETNVVSSNETAPAKPPVTPAARNFGAAVFSSLAKKNAEDLKTAANTAKAATETTSPSGKTTTTTSTTTTTTGTGTK